MATRTSADLTVAVLTILINLPEGQQPEVEDATRVTSELQTLMAELAGREIVYVPDIENIQDTIFLSLAKIVAYELRTRFGVTAETESILMKQNQEGIANIQVITRGRPTYEPLKTLSF